MVIGFFGRVWLSTPTPPGEITDDRQHNEPSHVCGKASDADLLRKMIGFAAERLMELEVGSASGAAHGEKNPLHLAQRNGYRDGDWETRASTVELRIPKCSPSATMRQTGQIA